MADPNRCVVHRTDRVVMTDRQRQTIVVGAPTHIVKHDVPSTVIQHSTNLVVITGQQGLPGRDGYSNQEIYHDPTMPQVTTPALWMKLVTSPSGVKFVQPHSNKKLT